MVLKPLLELERLSPEVELLTKSQPNWPIADNAALVRLSGLVTKVERLRVRVSLPYSVQGGGDFIGDPKRERAYGRLYVRSVGVVVARRISVG